MLDSHPIRAMNKTRIVLLSADAEFTQLARSAFGADGKFDLSVVDDWLRGGRVNLEIGSAAVVIIDLTNGGQEELSGLQRLMNRDGHQLPVIVVLQDFNEVLARKLVQMHVADLFVKPVTPGDLVRGCIRFAQSASDGETKESKIYTFLPVAGGVGATTLAIQSAMTLLNSNSRRKLSTCLIDLNFNQGACADYLDIEPLLDLMEIEPNLERLDRQLLEGMVSHHSSGLAVIATANYPTEMRPIDQNIVMGLLNLVCQCFDHIVVDMPRMWQSWTDNVLLGSNRLFLVSDTTVPGVRRAKQLVAALSTRLGQGPQPKVDDKAEARRNPDAHRPPTHRRIRRFRRRSPDAPVDRSRHGRLALCLRAPPDAARESAYDRQSSIGRLDAGLDKRRRATRRSST